MIDEEVVTLLPDLGQFARKLTRDRVNAEDLVQDTVCRALAKQELFEPGTDLKRWLFKMMFRRYLDVKKTDHLCFPGDAMPTPSVPASQEMRVLMREVAARIEYLSAIQITPLLMTAMGDTSEEIAEAIGELRGTVLSRVSRARAIIREFAA